MILLDTHVWVWFVNQPDLLPATVLAEIDAARDGAAVGVSCISTWEVFMLTKRGRLKFRVPTEVWVERCERLPFLRFIPVDNAIARAAVNLPESFHADPADRIITATAITLGCPLLTKDEKIRAFSGVQTRWA